MSDDFKVGDMAARVQSGPVPPGREGVALPPIGKPYLVTRVIPHRDAMGTTQMLDLAGWPLPPFHNWCSRFFRKVPPAELKEEPRRVADKEPVPA